MHHPTTNYENRLRGYRFGERTTYSNFHLGEDLIGISGENLYAVDDGIITKVENLSKGGNTIHLLLNSGELIRYLHQSKFLVKKYDKVKSGQVIGLMGSTGVSSQNHLHWDISKNGKLELNNLLNFQNPEVWIKEHLMPDYSKYNDKIIRNTQTGGFALVIHGKKYRFGNLAGESQDALALLTILTRNKTLPSVQVDDATFNAIPLSNGLDF